MRTTAFNFTWNSANFEFRSPCGWISISFFFFCLAASYSNFFRYKFVRATGEDFWPNIKFPNCSSGIQVFKYTLNIRVLKSLKKTFPPGSIMTPKVRKFAFKFNFIDVAFKFSKRSRVKSHIHRSLRSGELPIKVDHSNFEFFERPRNLRSPPRHISNLRPRIQTLVGGCIHRCVESQLARHVHETKSASTGEQD